MFKPPELVATEYPRFFSSFAVRMTLTAHFRNQSVITRLLGLCEITREVGENVFGILNPHLHHC